MIAEADLKVLLFDALLSYLLFAGAMHVDFKKLWTEKKHVLSFATISVLLSTAIVAVFIFFLAQLFGIQLSKIECLLFGALISPTDPVAALAILNKTSISSKIKTRMEGESLFNDGVGVVIFSGILLFHNNSESVISLGKEISMLFLEEVVGGVIFGFIVGFMGYFLLKKSLKNSELKIILSLGIASAAYTIAQALHFSGPLALVVAGIIIGNKMHLSSKGNSRNFNSFWHTLDEILNGIVFLLTGLSLHLLHFEILYLPFLFISIVIVLFSRYVSIRLPYTFLKKGDQQKGVIPILTWGGLRGAISLALAFSLPKNETSDLIVLTTFVIVSFSIIVQGLTIGKLAKTLE